MKKLSTLSFYRHVTNSLLTAVVLTVFMLAPLKAYALIEVPTLRFGVGHSEIKFSAGSKFPDEKLGSAVTLNPMFLWDVPSVRARVGVHFLTDLMTNFGPIATSGIGLTFLFYPLGLSSSREVRDDFSVIVKTRLSPYFHFAITPTKLSVTRPQSTDDIASNVPLDYATIQMVELNFGVGVDYPLANDFTLFGGIHYRSAAFTSLDAHAGSTPNDTANVVKYSGIGILVGFMTNFY